MKCVLRLVVAMIVGASITAAQGPIGADKLTAPAVADSQAALKQLDVLLRRDGQNPAIWLHRGMIGWALHTRAEADPPIKGLDVNMLRRLTDTTMIIAGDLAQKDFETQLTVAVWLRTATDISTRSRAENYLSRAYELSKTSGNRALQARAAVEMGRLRWLSYEIVPWKAPPCELLAPSIDSASILGTADDMRRLTPEYAVKHLHNELMDCFGKTSMFDNADYMAAEARFREARTVAPADVRAYQHLAMVLLERKRWNELESLARSRLASGRDAWAMLTLGLAQHRSGNSAAALASFDSGAALLEPAERARLLSFTKLLNQRDSLAFVAGGPAVLSAREREFWGFITPLWSRPSADPRAEFLARVVYAELRWTVEERGVRGADSDRGRVYIRYGPPDRMFVVRGCDFYMESPPWDPPQPPRGCNPLIPAQPGTGSLKPRMADVISYWDYDIGLTLVFWGAPTYGTAKYPVSDNMHSTAIVDQRSASFDDLARETILDLPLRTARFRAPADSSDLLLVLQVPMPDIRAGGSTDSPARLHFWISPRNEGRTVRDSGTMRGSGVGRMISRLPLGQYFFRVEATADGSMTAARSMGWTTIGRDSATGFVTRGFGVSDLVLASDVRPAKPQPARWTDYGIAPVLHAVPKGSTLQLLWENYELGNRSGQAEYTIAVSIEPIRSKADRIAASVVNALARAVGVDREKDRVRYRFERITPHATAIVDAMGLALAETPAGDYRIVIEIADKVSGRKTSASSVFTIAEAR